MLLNTPTFFSYNCCCFVYINGIYACMYAFNMYFYCCYHCYYYYQHNKCNTMPLPTLLKIFLFFFLMLCLRILFSVVLVCVNGNVIVNVNVKVTMYGNVLCCLVVGVVCVWVCVFCIKLPSSVTMAP